MEAACVVARLGQLRVAAALGGAWRAKRWNAQFGPRRSARRSCSPTSPAYRPTSNASQLAAHGIEVSHAPSTGTSHICARHRLRHRGDVLAIAAIAFFSYWPVDDDRQLHRRRHARDRSGDAIQAHLGERQGVAGHDFQTRPASGPGSSTIAFVGRVGGRWEPCRSERRSPTSRARAPRAPGTVAIAESAWLLIADRWRGGAWMTACTTDRGAPPVAHAGRVARGAESQANCSPRRPLPVRPRRPRRHRMDAGDPARDCGHGQPLPGAARRRRRAAHLGVQAFQRVMARFEGAAKVLVDNKG